MLQPIAGKWVNVCMYVYLYTHMYICVYWWKYMTRYAEKWLWEPSGRCTTNNTDMQIVRRGSKLVDRPRLSFNGSSLLFSSLYSYTPIL